MTDPLRAFTELIRSLSRARSTPSSSARNPASSAEPAGSASKAERSLHARVKERLSRGAVSPGKAHELFVETILLAELGEQLAQDSGFAELVTRVSEQLGSDPVLGARLDALLTDLRKS